MCNNNNFIINNFNQLKMFRAIISPILRSTRLCLQLWYKAPAMLPADDQDEEFHLFLVISRQHRRCFKPQAVLLRMGEIIARSILS